MRYICKDPVVRFRTVGLALTLQCNFECAHCITESGPRTRAQFTLREATRLIDGIAAESENICFTGGESLLRKDLLLKCLRRAKDRDLVPTLVTNGFWARDESSTRRMLAELADGGLFGICVSLDRFHLPFVRQEHAQRIAALASEYGLQHIVRICHTKDDEFPDVMKKDPSSKGIRFHEVQVLRLGRAKSFPPACFDRAPDCPNHHCTTVLSPLALPSGLVQACCGPGIHFSRENPLNLGNWREESIRTILHRARTDAFTMMLNNFGPVGFLRMVRERNGRIAGFRKRRTYTGICELCLDMLNNRDLVRAAERLFEDRELQMKMIAGQVYLQSHIFLKDKGYLDLPTA